MANLLHKLLKKPSNGRIITCFNHQNPPNLVVPPLLHQPHINHTQMEDDSDPIGDFQSKAKLTHYHQLQIYPSFPFGFCLHPISASGFDASQFNKTDASQFNKTDGFESDESRKVWADSVKKKRKKKMNKHKYKKLRKRLRRKT